MEESRGRKKKRLCGETEQVIKREQEMREMIRQTVWQIGDTVEIEQRVRENLNNEERSEWELEPQLGQR